MLRLAGTGRVAVPWRAEPTVLAPLWVSPGFGGNVAWLPCLGPIWEHLAPIAEKLGAWWPYLGLRDGQDAVILNA